MCKDYLCLYSPSVFIGHALQLNDNDSVINSSSRIKHRRGKLF